MIRKCFVLFLATLIYSFATLANSADDTMTVAAQTRDKMMKADIYALYSMEGIKKMGADFEAALPAGWTLLAEEDLSTIDTSILVQPYINGWVLDAAGAPRLSFFYYLGDVRFDYSPNLSVSVIEPQRSERLQKELQNLTSAASSLELDQLKLLRDDQVAVTQMARDAGCTVAERDEKGNLICMSYEGHNVIVVDKMDECHAIEAICSETRYGVGYLTGLHCSRSKLGMMFDEAVRFMMFNGYFHARCR